MFRVSVKLVVILLLIVTSGVVVFCVSIPIALQLQDNAMDFVLQELTSATEAVQAVVNRKLRLMENMADVLRKASSTGFLLNDILQFANWASLGVVQQQLDVSLFTPQGFGVAVTSDTTATISGAASPGYLWVINFTAPGSFLDIVQLPLDSTQISRMSSWTRINTTFQCQQLVGVLPITSSSIDEDPIRWVGVSPFQSMPGGSVQSSLVLGGVVNKGIAAMRPDKAQFVVVGLRGEMLVKSFLTPGVFHDDNGVALLIDTISGAYVAGNLDDATGTVHQSGSAQLLQVADLQDPRIAGFLRAKLHSSSFQITPSTALMTCSTPCSFTYWPHLNEVVDSPRKTAGFWNVLTHSFASVRVVDVGPSGHTPHGTIALRLVVVVPSDQVIHNLIDEMQKTSLAPYILMICICAVLTVVVECWLFNDLIRLGEGMLILASVFAAQSDSEPMTLAEELQCNIKTTSSSFFVEFERASQAISTLDREMHMLRAFSTLPTISIPGSKFSPNLEENRHDHTFPFESLTEFSGLVAANDPLPYCAPKGTLWRAPVTFVCAQLHPD
ncbi:transmembrane protein, putative, partial [Bodo saltans]